VPRTASRPSESIHERFRDHLERHRKIVFKVANLYGRGEEDRRDLAQEISAQLWRAFPRYDPERPFSTWMYRIALNVAISFARSAVQRARYAVPLDEETPDPIDPARAPDDRVQALHGFMSRLDELNRALLLLYLDEHSYREIAEVLGISETNVATKLSRLKQRIRAELGQPDRH